MVRELIVASVLAIGFSGCAESLANVGVQESGVYVSESDFDSLKVKKARQSDVEMLLGRPSRTSYLNNGTIWYYDYEKNSKFGDSISSGVAFEFNSKGVLTKKSKTKGNPNKTNFSSSGSSNSLTDRVIDRASNKAENAIDNALNRALNKIF